MKACDFIYDGIALSDLGFQICHFDSLGVETISMGSEISFNMVSAQNGIRHYLTSSSYEDCLTANIQICKNLCDDSNMYIDLETQRDIMRWLNRKSYHAFKLIGDDDYVGINFESSFNVSKIEVCGKVVGFELEMFTNRPFATGNPVTINLDIEADDLVDTVTKRDGIILNNVCKKTIYSKSDEENCIYPDMQITIKEAGDLEIYNALEDRTMKIANCKNGEIITINYPLIESSLGEERDTKIQNDFNWEFFRIASTFKNRLNEFTISLPCTIKIKYSPIIKVGI